MGLYYTILSGIYATGFALAPILSNRIIEIFGFHILLGGVAIAVVCGILDVINNSYGLKKAKEAVVSGLIVRLFIYAFIGILALLPVFKESPGFDQIVLISLRMMLASELASFVSQYFIDINIFNWFRDKSKSFYIRYNLSNLVSTAIHSLVFVPVAMLGTPKQELIVPLIIGGYFSKIVIQIILTPIFSLLTKLIKHND